MKKGIYAIRDNVANAIVGGIHLHAAHAPAIRFFSDVANAEGTMIWQHLVDHDLLHVATIDDETGAIDPSHLDPIVVLTGQTLADTWAAQKAAAAASTEG